MHRVLGLVLTAAIAALVLAAPASAEPTIGVTETCVFSDGRFVVAGNGFDAGRRVLVEVMGTADPAAGEPLLRAEASTDADGNLNATLAVPATAGSTPAERSVRVRSNSDPAGGVAPALLATAPLKTAPRAVSVLPGATQTTAGGTERFSVTGLPEGSLLFAHYRRGGRTIARRSLGTVQEICGRTAFTLRVLPAGRERAGAWDVWITTARRFVIPRRGVYIHRRLVAGGDGPKARVRLAAPDFRLVPVDARAAGPVTNAFAADATSIGVIKLIFSRAEGAQVEYFEQIGDRLRQLGARTAPRGALTILEDAAPWSCDRLVRRFFATAILPNGTRATGAHTVRTASCADRFRLSVPRRVAPGGRASIRVVDRWGIGGIRPQLCVTAPKSRARCRGLAFAGAVSVATSGVRASRRGLWKVDLRIRGHRVRGSFGVGAGAAAAPSAPTVLATGDSMMQGIDSFLADELGERGRVRSDIRPGAGVSRQTGEWESIATAQAATVKPRVTVISIGAAEGFTMTAPGGDMVKCCDDPWVVEYTRRVRAMMATYARGGKGRVIWLTVPLPRLAARLPASRAVNDAILRAAQGQPGVTVLRMDLLFSPNGFQDAIRYRGRLVRIREIDGIHLNVPGTAIAAKVIAEAIASAR